MIISPGGVVFFQAVDALSDADWDAVPTNVKSREARLFSVKVSGSSSRSLP
jgi:hypothetical protein